MRLASEDSGLPNNRTAMFWQRDELGLVYGEHFPKGFLGKLILLQLGLVEYLVMF